MDFPHCQMTVSARPMEFIVADSIKVHPMALAHPERIADPHERDEIARQKANYRNRAIPSCSGCRKGS